MRLIIFIRSTQLYLMDVWWVETGLLDGVFELDGNVDEFMSFGHLGNWVVSKVA